MVALMVAFILILSVLYQAWIRKIPVLAGVTIPALIMILYGGWVLFLAKKDKQRRINAVSTRKKISVPTGIQRIFTFQENNLRASRADSLALTDVICIPQTLSTGNTSAAEEKGDVSKKSKSKNSKIIEENSTVDKKLKLEKSLPQIAVSTYDGDGKLSRSFSTYN